MYHRYAYQFKAFPEGGIWLGNNISKEGMVDVAQLGSGLFRAEYKVEQGSCEFNDFIDFEILLLPQPEITMTTNEVCPDQPIELFISNNYYNADVLWYTKNAENVINNGDSYSTGIIGEYYARFDLEGCQSVLDSVTLVTMQDSLFVPNVITFNGDGLNDDFRFYKQGAKGVTLSILNRWGELVYFDDNDELIWYPDNEPSGVYYWQINYLTCNSQAKSIKGWVQVLKE